MISMDYVLSEKYRQGPCRPSPELEEYISSTIVKLCELCIPTIRSKLMREQQNQPLSDERIERLFRSEYQYFCYLLTYRAFAFFADNHYVTYKARADFLNPELTKNIYVGSLPALGAGNLYDMFYVAYTDTLPTAIEDQLDKKAISLYKTTFLDVIKQTPLPSSKPPIPLDVQKDLCSIKASVERLWITYDNAILDISSTSKTEIETLYNNGQITKAQRDEGIQSMDALYQLISSCPQLIESTTYRLQRELYLLSAKYSFNITDFIPEIPGKRSELPAPQPRTTYAPPKKMGFSFWLILLAAAGAVIAAAIYFNR